MFYNEKLPVIKEYLFPGYGLAHILFCPAEGSDRANQTSKPDYEARCQWECYTLAWVRSS